MFQIGIRLSAVQPIIFLEPPVPIPATPALNEDGSDWLTESGDTVNEE
jgi:hypothetical protein